MEVGVLHLVCKESNFIRKQFVMSIQRIKASIFKGKILSGQNRETLLHYSVNYNETVQVEPKHLKALSDLYSKFPYVRFNN